MKLTIKVTPGAKKNEFKQEGDLIKIFLKAPPVEGKANEALIHFLSEHFDVRVSKIEIVKGLKSRQKVVNIEGI
jgi:uncharacterized protein (TIGR00251 family)